MTANEICEELWKNWEKTSTLFTIDSRMVFPFLDSMYDLRDALKTMDLSEVEKGRIYKTINDITQEYRKLCDIEHNMFLVEEGILQPGEEWKGEI